MSDRLPRWTLTLLVGALAWAGTADRAHAQSEPAFSTQQFRPTAGPYSLFTTETSPVLGHLGWSAGLLYDYGNRLLVEDLTSQLTERLDLGETGAIQRTIVEHMSVLHLSAALGLYEYVEVGVVLPFVLYSDAALEGEALQSSAVGDAALIVKARALRNEDYAGFGLGGGVETTFPFAPEEALLGAGVVTARPFVILDYVFAPVPVRLVTNLGVRFQPETGEGSRGLDLVYTHAFDYRLGAQWAAAPGRLELSAEGRGSVQLGDAFGDAGRQPFEVLVGGRAMTGVGLNVTLASGAGLGEGVATPSYRFILGLEYAFPPLAGASTSAARGSIVDADGDGVSDDLDRCPQGLEDRDWFVDDDGCPDPDNDEDGVLDDDDRCPIQAGVAENNGCPEGVDAPAPVEGPGDAPSE